MYMNWICKNCETKNEAHQICCYVCGALRDEVKAVDYNGQDGADKRNRAKKTKYDGEKKSWLRAFSVMTLLALMIFGLLFVGIRLFGRSVDNAATGSDRDAIAVRIGDKYTITKGEIADQYEYMVSMYSAYGMDAPTMDEDIEAMQDSVVASLVTEKIQLYKADQLGITLSDEQKAEVEKQVDEQMTSYMDSFREQAEQEGAADVEARTLEIFQEQINAAGMELDVDGFRNYMAERYTEEAIKEALKAEVTKNSDVDWETQIEIWENDTKLVKYFEYVYRSIGK
jgi:uncharacterized protein YaaR (DUF327 family)